ncbi:insulin-like growth factor II isoform X2 [Bicyclus anynana]|uniref:Insulin-like growth factor II isoform X2 n=1 Tax=Bicyclus anynana TaxID=110368 RepID=A0ABM3LGX3_BICAN|nr:insulin-like growth factor II isoform X2 [Bicyclus anynana]
MLVNKIVQLAVFVLTVAWDCRCDAATVAVKLCGRELSDFMSRICHQYNSPNWDVPTVIEQPAAVVRRKRRTGIVDECCVYGCTWEQLSSYCAISAKSESPLDSMEAHMIADRSAEAVVSPAVLGEPLAGEDPRREVGRRRSGYGRARARGRRCRCRRKRRSGRRRSSLMGISKQCRARCSRPGHGLPAADVGPDPQH